MKKVALNPKKLFNSRQYGFSQVAISDPGKMVFISGQVAWDENQVLVGKDNLLKQTKKAFDNLEVAIKGAGGNLENIVMLRIYKVNYQPEDGPIISKVLKEKFGTQDPPVSTWISVQGLANEGFLIEVEAQAIV